MLAVAPPRAGEVTILNVQPGMVGAVIYRYTESVGVGSVKASDMLLAAPGQVT